MFGPKSSKMFLSTNMVWGAVSHDTTVTVRHNKNPYPVTRKTPNVMPHSRHVSHNIMNLIG
jgi:hypothetical protein